MNNKYLSVLCITIISATTISGAFAATSFLQPTSFPTTSDNTTFSEKRENLAIGYKPFADSKAYKQIEIETEEEYINRLIEISEIKRQHDEQNLSLPEYCNLYPLDDDRCPQAPGLYESIIAIGDRTPPVSPDTQTPPTDTTTPEKPSKEKPAPKPEQTPQEQPVPLPIPPVVTKPRPPVLAQNKNHIHNGPCTPPQRSNHFTNKILTSGRYAKIDPAFEKAMITVFRTEGGCVNDPNDSGGYTCYGVSQRNNPEINVRNITRADAEDIAYKKYYTQYNIHHLPDNSRGNVFILGWGSGTVTAIQKFCQFLGIKKKKKITSEVIAAAENYNGDIHNDFLDYQQDFYKRIAKKGKNKRYLKGWMNRIRLMRENGCHTQTTSPLTR